MSLVINDGDWPDVGLLKIVIDKPLSERESSVLNSIFRVDDLQVPRIVLLDVTPLLVPDFKTSAILKMIRNRLVAKHKTALFMARHYLVQTNLRTVVGAMPHEIFTDYGAAFNRIKTLVEPAAKPSLR